MKTAAKKPDGKNESGQSVIEFLIMLPLLLGFVMYMVRTNTVIQMSIVDQQYARAQTLFLAFNSPVYPQVDRQNGLGSTGISQMTLGVSENAPADATQDYVPAASAYKITRDPNRQIASDSIMQDTPDQRTLVRVRNTTTLCSPSLYMKTSGGVSPLLSGSEGSWVATTIGETQSSQAFDYCGSTINYEQ